VPNEDIVKGYKVDTDTFVEVTKEELRERRAGIDQDDRDRRVRRPDRDRSPLPDAPLLSASGRQAGHDAFAVIRETIREMDKVAIVAWC
jgi:DNA end-binding protein Ku